MSLTRDPIEITQVRFEDLKTGDRILVHLEDGGLAVQGEITAMATAGDIYIRRYFQSGRWAKVPTVIRFDQIDGRIRRNGDAQ